MGDFLRQLHAPMMKVPSMDDSVVKPFQNTDKYITNPWLGWDKPKLLEPPSKPDMMNPTNFITTDSGQIIPFKMDRPDTKSQEPGTKKFGPEDYSG